MTRLTHTYRYDPGRPLGQLVRAVREGDAEAVCALLEAEGGDDLFWTGRDGLSGELDRAAGHWAAALQTHVPEAHFAHRSRYVMLTPFRTGPLGTRALGAAIRARLPASAPGFASVTPILIEQNSYELGVYNGDFAMRIDDTPAIAIVQSEDEGFRQLAEARLPLYSEAFALSVHKSQGSEFEEVLIVLPEQDVPLLSRELFYTAFSRARSKVRVVGPPAVLRAAMTRRAQRHSGLVDAIRELAASS